MKNLIKIKNNQNYVIYTGSSKSMDYKVATAHVIKGSTKVNMAVVVEGIVKIHALDVTSPKIIAHTDKKVTQSVSARMVAKILKATAKEEEGSEEKKTPTKKKASSSKKKKKEKGEVKVTTKTKKVKVTTKRQLRSTLKSAYGKCESIKNKAGTKMGYFLDLSDKKAIAIWDIEEKNGWVKVPA